MKFFDGIKTGLCIGTILAVPSAICCVMGYAIASVCRDEGYEKGRAEARAEADRILEKLNETKLYEE
jgi:hypothetical protein